MTHEGGSMSPFIAWLMRKGLVTLDLRCRAMADSARGIVRSLEGDARLWPVIGTPT